MSAPTALHLTRQRRSARRWSRHLLGACSVLLLAAGTAAAQESLIIRNVSIIDGTGAALRPNATVVVEGGRIAQILDARTQPGSTDADVIDGRGKFLLPGFIDSNVHASIYGNSQRRETVVKYGNRNEELILEFVQRQLKHGVTTVRDSYGALLPLIAVRDRIERGEATGSRLLVAGNIVGWGGPFSMTFSLMQESELTQFQASWNDWIAQDVGEDLMDMGPEEVRAAINAYLDKGPNFMKYGGTSHFRQPSLIGFSPRVQAVLVEETHRRGLIAETHSTSQEALRMSVDAGIDLIQHPEILSRDYPDDLLQRIVDRDVLCAMRSNTLAGAPWQDYLRQRQEQMSLLRNAPPPRTSAERRARESLLMTDYEIQRRNAERLIRAGCRVTIATDNYQGRAPEFRKAPKPEIQEAGIGSILAIEGLVELGMTEMQALVAATRNGASAAGMLDSLGTIEVGKIADLLLLRSNPLDNIANIRTLDQVIARGKLVDIEALPESPLFSAPDRSPSASLREPALPPPTAVDASDSDSRSDVARARQPERSAQPGDDAQRIASITRAPLGNWIVEFENGERWRQLNSDNTNIVLPEDRSGLTARLERGLFGSTRLTIQGTGRSFKVSRVKSTSRSSARDER